MSESKKWTWSRPRALFEESNFKRQKRSKKPLASVKRIVQAGHAVVFAPDEMGGSFILNLQSMEENRLREDDGNFLLDVWVPPPEALGFVGHP